MGIRINRSTNRRIDRPSPMGATAIRGTVTVDPKTGIVMTLHDTEGKLIGKSDSKKVAGDKAS